MKITSLYGIIDVYESMLQPAYTAYYITIDGTAFQRVPPTHELHICNVSSDIHVNENKTVCQVSMTPGDYAILKMNFLPAVPKNVLKIDFNEFAGKTTECRCSPQSLLFAGHEKGCSYVPPPSTKSNVTY